MGPIWLAFYELGLIHCVAVIPILLQALQSSSLKFTARTYFAANHEI